MYVFLANRTVKFEKNIYLYNTLICTTFISEQEDNDWLRRYGEM